MKRDIDGDDKRKVALRLTGKGVEVYNNLVPLVKQVEEDLLAGLSKEEVLLLISTMEKIRLNGMNVVKANKNKFDKISTN